MKFCNAPTRCARGKVEDKVHQSEATVAIFVFVFSLAPKHEIGADVKYLLFVKFSQMSFIGFGWEVENVLDNQS